LTQQRKLIITVFVGA